MLSHFTFCVCGQSIESAGNGRAALWGEEGWERCPTFSFSEALVNTGCRKCSVCGKQEESMERDVGVKQSIFIALS